MRNHKEVRVVKKVFICLLLFTFVFLCIETVHAETTTRVIITLPLNSENKNVREAPNGKANKLGVTANYGTYRLLDEKPYPGVDGDNTCSEPWYKIYFNGKDGYICGENVEFVKSHATDDIAPSTDCEKQMSALGFPSSYWGGLCRLKEKYPSWTFEAIKVDTDWSDVIKGESSCGWNLIRKNTTNENFIDTSCEEEYSGYMSVLPVGLAYFMDPRNFLSEGYIFQFNYLSYANVLESSYFTTVDAMLNKASFYIYHKQNDFANILIEAAKEVNACPIFTSARIYQELGADEKLFNLYSGTGKYIDASGVSYTGYYNFYNIGVTDTCAKDFGTTFCGLRYAVNKGWNTLSLAIQGGIRTISAEYINKNQYTTYLQKFNVLGYGDRKPYSHQYQTNVQAPSSESTISFSTIANNKALDLPFLFKIPVYKNMDAFIDNSGNGSVNDGDSTVPKPSTIPIHTIVTSSGYKYESGYIGVPLHQDVSTLKGALESVGGNSTVVITNAAGESVTSGQVGTGFKVSINNQSTTEVLEVVVKGDTSGDGEINALDLLQIQKSILGTYTLSGASLKAGDTSGDGEVNALDLLQVQKHILGTYTIK